MRQHTTRYFLWYRTPSGDIERCSAALSRFGTFNGVANLLHDAAGVAEDEAEQFATDARAQWDADVSAHVTHPSGWSFHLEETRVRPLEDDGPRDDRMPG